MTNCENCTAKDEILTCSYCGSNLCGNCLMNHEYNCACGYYDHLDRVKI